jgi:hypothetical protein
VSRSDCDPRPDFVAACERVESLREQLLTSETATDFAEYVSLLSSVTEDIDLTQAGASVDFVWRGKGLANPDFDTCCLGHNVCIGVLTAASRLKLQTDEIVTGEYVTLVKTARTVATRCLEIFRDDFKAGVSRATLQNLSNFINGCFVYAIAAHSSFVKPRDAITARLARAAATSLRGQNVQYFLWLYADVVIARAEADAGNWGAAIAAGRMAFERFDKLPMMATEEIDFSRAVIVQFRPELVEAERRNKKVYMQTIPVYKEPPEEAQCPCPVIDGFWRKTSILD